MENAVKSLEIVFGVMIFVLALSITMSMFTQARQTLQAIVEIREADEAYVTDANGNYINYVNSNGETRTVGIETIIPMMYRAYIENFEIQFYLNADTNKGAFEKLYTKTNEDKKEIYYCIDLEKEKHANAKKAIENLKMILNDYGLYEKLEQMTFIEKLGEYYQDDENGITEDIAEVNKTKKRVIIYMEQ